MDKVLDAKIIRERLNQPQARRVIYSLMRKDPERDRGEQEAGVRRTIMMFLNHGMTNDAFLLGEWWRLSEQDALTPDMIRFIN